MRYLYSHTIDQLYLFSVEFLALATLYVCLETSWPQRGNLRNNVFQLAMQQCCETISVEKRWPYLLDLIANKRDSIGFIGFSIK